MNRPVRWSLAALLLFGAIQFIPYGHDHRNPEVLAEPEWDSPQTRELFTRACGDCHSHRTRWPAYASVAPVSWLIAHDVAEGREKFNVSAWGMQKRNKGKDAAEELQEGEMPPAIYTMMHPEARLSAEEKKRLIDGLKRTFGEEKKKED